MWKDNIFQGTGNQKQTDFIVALHFSILVIKTCVVVFAKEERPPEKLQPDVEGILVHGKHHCFS